MYLKSLFTGLTTIFCWTPATLLMVFVLYGFYSAFLNIFIVPFDITLSLILMGAGGTLGYIAITSICWGIKLARKMLIGFLSVGVISLCFAIFKGATSENELLLLRNEWLDWYLFVGPLVFALIHVILMCIREFGKTMP